MTSEDSHDKTRLVLLVFIAGIVVGLLLRGNLLGGIGAWNNNKVVFGNFLIGFGNNIHTQG
ncbi:MAG: hypothetical protein H6672_03855 [Anaerolineaceae bacterium]|nr:hypothetical protein [Anaerolineaceae bacterium]